MSPEAHDQQPEVEVSSVRKQLLRRKEQAQEKLDRINEALAELDKPGVEEAIHKINQV